MASTLPDGHLLERGAEASVGGPGERKGLPKFDYHLEESDPDVVVLRRQDGAFVAAFSARGATREGILEAAKEDYAKLVEAFSDRMDSQGNDAQTRE
jgi:hypothetical protein